MAYDYDKNDWDVRMVFWYINDNRGNIRVGRSFDNKGITIDQDNLVSSNVFPDGIGISKKNVLPLVKAIVKQYEELD